jgi:hypothetical protein
MSLTPYSISVSVFVTALESLDAILSKAVEFCAARKVDPAVLCATRLIPDMLPLARQVMIACDHAKNGTSRISAVEPPKFEDTETTIEQLKERIAKTIAYVKSIDEAAVNSAPGRIVEFSVGPNKIKMEAVQYMIHFCTPNFYFHMTTAYAILRSSGVEIGKRDFMGVVPGLMPA